MVNDLSLLKTNLTPPLLCDDVIERPRLLARMQKSLLRALTLVCAPAGSGKTTLVVQWLAEFERALSLRAGWLALDSDGDNGRVDLWLSQVLAAVQSVFPRALIDLDRMVHAQSLPSNDHLTAQLINDIAELPSEFVLIIENYHLIQNPAIHDIMARLLENCPPQLHVVITSRTEPPLHINSLRARGQLVEIRQEDLRFDVPETTSFLTRVLGETPSSDIVRIFGERTEGWAVGLRLAAISACGDNLADVASNLRDTQRHVVGYLTDEVLARQSEATKDFLLRTAILDRICAPVAAALSDGGSVAQAETHIRDLVASNLFLLSADSGAGVWYRYHALFRMFLKARLDANHSQSEIRAMHLRAAHWFAGQSHIEEALRHALAAGDEELAADLVEGDVMRVLNNLDRVTLNFYIDLLPRAVVERRPGLLLAKGWALRWSMEIAAVPALLERANLLLANEPPERREQFRAHLLAFDTLVQWARADAECCMLSASEALKGLPEDSYFLRGIAQCGLIFSLQMMGRAQEALDVVHAARTRYGNLFDAYSMRLAIGDFATSFLEGWMEQAAAAANHMLVSSRRVNMTLGVAWGVYLSGLVAFEQGNFDSALQHFASLEEIAYGADMGSVIDVKLGTALVYALSNRPDEADAALEGAMALAIRSGSHIFANEVAACRARCALATGNVDLAWRLLPQPIVPEVRRRPFYTIGNPEITATQVLIARGQREDLALARRYLDAISAFVQETNVRAYEPLVNLLQALYYQKIERNEAAETALNTALTLGAQRGVLRPFIELVKPLESMLRQQLARGVEPLFIQRILERLPQGSRQKTPGAAPLIKPLTNRELDVLEFLVKRYSNQEIADALVVAPNTIRAHLVRLFEKLGADNRRDAVIKAREYGLIA